MQNSIFDEMYDDYKQTKPLRVIEFFAGYGSQLQALRYLQDFFGKDKINYQHYKICEWALPSIIAYADMHKDELEDYGNNFCGDLTKEQIAKELCSMGVSLDYNEPATYEKLCRVSEDRLRLCFNSIMWTDNLVDISRVKGSELNINDTDMFTYLLTYSFPCVLAGTKIITDNGYKNIEDIKVDDKVLTHKNRFCKVNKIMNRISNHYYTIKALGVPKLYLTEEHPLYVLRDNKEQWVKVKDLRLDDKISFNINRESKDVNLTKEQLWLLGRYVADGFINKKLYNSTMFAIGYKKEQEFLNNIPSDYKNRFKKFKKACWEYRLADKDFQEKCLEFGTGALNKKIPQWVIDLPKDKLQSFFNGYISGDGHVRKRGNTQQIMFASVSENIYLGMQQIIAKLYNCICSCSIRVDDRKETFNNSYNCQFNVSEKHIGQIVIDDKIFVKINSIVRNDTPIQVFNFEVDKDNSYTCQNVIVHNCQDLSLAGKRELMKKGSSTRSGLLWQVERILTELNEIGKNHLPQLLLMENVPQVHGAGAKNDFDDWIRFLEKLGYKCYYDDLIATDYGIPQTRNRTFMISILGDYNYRFPKPVKLKLRLKDLLENNVDKKYYLSDKIIEQISNWKSYQNPLDSVMGRESVCGTITTRIAESQDGGINASMKVYSEDLKETTNLRNYKDPKCIIENKAIRLCGLYDKEGETHQAGSIYDKNGCSPTLDCSSGGGNRQPFIIEKGLHNKNVIDTLNNNKNNIDNIDDVGYIDAYNRNIITDGTAKTILTGVDFRNQDFLIIKNATKQGYLKAYEGDGIDISSRMESHRGTVQNGKAQTLNTMGGENVGVVVKAKDIPNDKVIDLVGLRIRKLTPKECFRLQGVKDREIDFIMKNQTNSSGYHLAGDSICIAVLIAIFGELFRVDWRKCLPSENIKDWWDVNE